MKHPHRALKSLCLIAGACALFTPSASARVSDRWWPADQGTFSYTYLQGAYGEQSTTNNQTFELVQGRLSIGLGDLFYVAGSIDDRQDKKFDSITASTYSAVLGAHRSVSHSIDIFVNAGYSSTTFDVGPLSTDADGPQVGLGFRGVSPGKHLEAELHYSHRWLEDDSGSSDNVGNISFEVLWRATSHVGLVGGGNWEVDASRDTISSFSGGLRVWW